FRLLILGLMLLHVARSSLIVAAASSEGIVVCGDLRRTYPDRFFDDQSKIAKFGEDTIVGGVGLLDITHVDTHLIDSYSPGATVNRILRKPQSPSAWKILPVIDVELKWDLQNYIQ